MIHNSYGEKFAGFFSLKCFRVLLAAIVFVTGMMGREVVFAAKSIDQLNKELGDWGKKYLAESILVDVTEDVKTIDDVLKIEGARNLKPIMVKDQDGDESLDKVVGEIPPGQRIKAHFIYKTYPLSTVNEKRAAKGYNPVEYYNWNCTIHLIAKNNKNQIVKEITKTYKNTRDNILEYQATKDVARIEMKMLCKYVGQVKGHKDAKTGDMDIKSIILTLNNNLKPVAIGSTNKTNKESKNNKIAQENKKDGKQTSGEEQGREEQGDNSDAEADDSEDLPESDAAKTAAAIGTALGGGLLGGAGAVGGMLGGGGGGAAGGAGGSGSDSGNAHGEYCDEEEEDEAQVSQEPESFVYTDPATGAQTLYEKDPNTGEWYDPSTGAITDPTKLEEYSKQRMKDRAWMDDQMDNMRNRTTQTDRILQSDQERFRQQLEDIDRQGAKDKAAIRSGTYGMTDAERTDFLNKRQENYVSKQTAAHQTAKNWDRAVKAAEVTQKVADLAVDGLSVATGPAGKMIANVYTGVKNVAGETTDAIVNGKSVVGGIAKGAAKGGADIFQNLAEGKWYTKLATYVGTETGKEVIVATIDGESKTAALQKGLVNGGMKWSVDLIGDNISGGVAQQNANAMKQQYKKINRVWNKDLSQKSVNTLTHMNFQKYYGKETTRELAQGFGQSITKEIGSATYDTAVEGKSATESMFGEKW